MTRFACGGEVRRARRERILRRARVSSASSAGQRQAAEAGGRELQQLRGG